MGRPLSGGWRGRGLGLGCAAKGGSDDDEHGRCDP